jgi:hypothetical protein
MVTSMKQQILGTLLFFPFFLVAQERVLPRISPISITAARYKDTYLKVIYSQPSKNGREVFGKLVPYGKIWRTGANEATEITITKDILLNNQLVKAGTYSLLTIPEVERWTIILNKDLGMWGSYNYNSNLDVIQLVVPVVQLKDKVFESFTILIDQKTDKATLLLIWDKTSISIPIQFKEPN